MYGCPMLQKSKLVIEFDRFKPVQDIHDLF